MSNRISRPNSAAMPCAEVPGLAYFNAPAVLAPAPAAQRKQAKLPSLDQMFAYYTAE